MVQLAVKALVHPQQQMVLAVRGGLLGKGGGIGHVEGDVQVAVLVPALAVPGGGQVRQRDLRLVGGGHVLHALQVLQIRVGVRGRGHADHRRVAVVGHGAGVLHAVSLSQFIQHLFQVLGADRDGQGLRLRHGGPPAAACQQRRQHGQAQQQAAQSLPSAVLHSFSSSYVWGSGVLSRMCFALWVGLRKLHSILFI